MVPQLQLTLAILKPGSRSSLILERASFSFCLSFSNDCVDRFKLKLDCGAAQLSGSVHASHSAAPDLILGIPIFLCCRGLPTALPSQWTVA